MTRFLARLREGLSRFFWGRYGADALSWALVIASMVLTLLASIFDSGILMLVSCTFLLTYTTSPLALTDGLEHLLSPLKKIKVPVHELAMMMSIALRFIPTLIEETDKIMSAQRARGASFDTGNLIQKAKALIPLLVPLFISAFRRAEELATAMECRCYHGGQGRTRMKQLHFRSADLLFMLGTVVLAVGVGLLGHWGW